MHSAMPLRYGPRGLAGTMRMRAMVGLVLAWLGTMVIAPSNCPAPLVLAASGVAANIRIVPKELLYVSEPPPELFGNAPNPKPGTGVGWTHQNWLKSLFQIRFAEYYNGPRNFGVLRVMNDDLVQPSRGFDTHPHRDMEIITYVVDGELTHKDSMGWDETLERGSIQFMTAGTGVTHSEHNSHKEKNLRFIQSWVVPRKKGLQPNYGSMAADAAAEVARKDKWCHLVSDVEATDTKTPVKINQDCNVHVVELSPDNAVPPLEIGAGRQGYLLWRGDIQRKR